MSDISVEGSAWAGREPITQAGKIAHRRALKAEVLAGATAYQELEADWPRLAAMQSGSVPFQVPDVLQCWSRHFALAANSLFTVVVVRDEKNNAVLIWPVLVEQRGVLRVARGAGAPVGQYDEILVDPDCDVAKAWQAATEELVRTTRPDIMLLERVRSDGALRAALGDKLAPLGDGEAAPYADLTGGVARFMSTLKSRVVRQQKKRVRRFEQEGVVGFEVATGGEQSEAWLAEAMDMKREWLRETGRFSRAFVKRETVECLADMARTLASPGASPRMVVSRLTLDGRTAAIEMGFCHRGVYHLYLGTFAADLAKFGPGNILTEKLLHWCAANEVGRYDMLAPRSRNKSEWQSGEVPVLDFAVPTTALGRVYAWAVLQRLLPAMRRGFYALPPSIRSALAGFALRKLPARAPGDALVRSGDQSTAAASLPS